MDSTKPAMKLFYLHNYSSFLQIKTIIIRYNFGRFKQNTNMQESMFQYTLLYSISTVQSKLKS